MQLLWPFILERAQSALHIITLGTPVHTNTSSAEHTTVNSCCRHVPRDLILETLEVAVLAVATKVGLVSFW